MNLARMKDEGGRMKKKIRWMVCDSLHPSEFMLLF